MSTTLTKSEIIEGLEAQKVEITAKLQGLVDELNQIRGALQLLGVDQGIRAPQQETPRKKPKKKPRKVSGGNDLMYGCKVGDRTEKKAHLEGLKSTSMAYKRVISDFKEHFKHVGRTWFERVS